MRKRLSMEIISGIYCIENIINGKKYIGSSKDIYGRWVQHENELNKGRHHSSYLQHAWNKYGKENFNFYIIEECEEDVLYEREQYYYDLYQCYGDNGYNMCPVSRAPAHKFTIEDVKRGNSKLSIEDINNIKKYLCETSIPIPQVAKLIGVGERTLYQIYFKEQYYSIFKDCNFIKRSKNRPQKLNGEIVDKIIKMCLEGKTNTEIGEELNVMPTTVSDIRCGNTWRHKTCGLDIPKSKKNMSKRKKPVLQYDLDGNLIKRWDSATDINKELGIDFRQISAACHGQKKVVNGFAWRFEGDPFDKYEISNRRYHKKSLHQ